MMRNFSSEEWNQSPSETVEFHHFGDVGDVESSRERLQVERNKLEALKLYHQEKFHNEQLQNELRMQVLMHKEQMETQLMEQQFRQVKQREKAEDKRKAELEEIEDERNAADVRRQQKRAEIQARTETASTTIQATNNANRGKNDALLFASCERALQLEKLEKVKQSSKAARAAAEEHTTKEQDWERCREVLHLTDDEIRADQREAKCLSSVKFAFLFVILGCELDLYGFVLAFIDYWEAARTIKAGVVMQAMLLIGPIGYFTAVGRYTFSYKDMEEEYNDGAEGVRERTELPKNVQKEPVHLRLYHFLPILRYYLLIKDQEPDDVEGLFRVNGLSSFTIGAAQIFCAIIGWSQGALELDVFLQIGIVAQAVNLLVTVLYFATPVAQMMKASVAIDAMIYASDEQLRSEFNQYDAAVQQLSKNPEDEEAKTALKELHEIANFEICEISRLTTLQVDGFEMKRKLFIRRCQRRRKINEFSRIGRTEVLKSKPWCRWCCGARSKKNVNSDNQRSSPLIEDDLTPKSEYGP